MGVTFKVSSTPFTVSFHTSQEFIFTAFSNWTFTMELWTVSTELSFPGESVWICLTLPTQSRWTIEIGNRITEGVKVSFLYELLQHEWDHWRREREEKRRRRSAGREGGKEVNGVVFLSYSAPERGERWGPGGTGWVVSMIGKLCVCLCVF